MLFSRRGPWWLAALLFGCGGTSSSRDGGRDGWVYDSAYDVALRDGASNDAVDVAPSVDVVLFDAASSDAAADAPTASDAGNGAACTNVGEQYARIIREAQSCQTSADCSTVVCETICCSCQVYVNGTPEQLETLAMLQAHWTELHCEDIQPCVRYACGAPAAAECTSAGRCATVRRGD